MLRSSASDSLTDPALDLPDPAGVVVVGLPDEVGTFEFKWLRVPSQDLPAGTYAFLVEAESVSGGAVLVPWFDIVRPEVGMETDRSESVTVTSRGVYRVRAMPGFSAAPDESAIGFGRPSGDLRVFSLSVQGGRSAVRRFPRGDGAVFGPRRHFTTSGSTQQGGSRIGWR